MASCGMRTFSMETKNKRIARKVWYVYNNNNNNTTATITPFILKRKQINKYFLYIKPEKRS